MKNTRHTCDQLGICQLQPYCAKTCALAQPLPTPPHPANPIEGPYSQRNTAIKLAAKWLGRVIGLAMFCALVGFAAGWKL